MKDEVRKEKVEVKRKSSSVLLGVLDNGCKDGDELVAFVERCL